MIVVILVVSIVVSMVVLIVEEVEVEVLIVVTREKKKLLFCSCALQSAAIFRGTDDGRKIPCLLWCRRHGANGRKFSFCGNARVRCYLYTRGGVSNKSAAIFSCLKASLVLTLIYEFRKLLLKKVSLKRFL